MLIAVPAVRKVANNTTDSLSKLWAVNCLASMGDWSALDTIKPSFLIKSMDLAYTKSVLLDKMLEAVKSPANPSISTAHAIAFLTDLVPSQDVTVRRQVASSLTSLGSKGVVPPLAALGLHDSDLYVRQIACEGLSKITGISESLWRNESAAAMALATEADHVPVFIGSLGPGATFDQKHLGALLNKRLAAQRSDWYKLPKWVGALKFSKDQLGVPTTDGWWRYRDHFNEDGWGGAGADMSRNITWYEYKRTYEPQISHESFTQRSSTVCFLLQRNRVKTATNQVMPQDIPDHAKVVGVWQQDDEETYRNVPDQRVRIFNIRRLYGADGTAQKKAPSGAESNADLRDVDVQELDPAVLQSAIDDNGQVEQLKAYLKVHDRSEELQKVQLALAELRRRVENLPPANGLVKGLRLSLSCSKTKSSALKDISVVASFHNQSDPDIALNLGLAIGGRKMKNFPTAVSLILTDASNRPVKIKHTGPGGVGGGMNAFVVNLPKGATYSLSPQTLIKHSTHTQTPE
jgi:hypothetical protein